MAGLAKALVGGLVALTLLSGCGQDEVGTTDGWLLRIDTEEGADGELSGAVYLLYDPETGAASARRVPATALAAYGAGEVLLVNADHTWSLLDTTVGDEGSWGRITLYSISDEETRSVPVRTWAGEAGLRPVAAAFDPAAPDLLRVVDTHGLVWKVDIAGRRATRDGDLPRRQGWAFHNRFDMNSGGPLLEDDDPTTDRTLPAGAATDGPVVRQGGLLIELRPRDRGRRTEAPGLPALPACKGFSHGFTDSAGVSWFFCSDHVRVEAYRLGKGSAAWKAYGKPSAKVIPDDAVGLSVVLPPVG